MNPIVSLRRALVSRPLLRWTRRMLPPMSDTEREAIEAGTVWWDAQLFSGKPDWKVLHAQPKAVLSREEQVFLDGPVAELCGMIDDWKINFELKNLPPEVWDFLREKRFFGMIIPKEYGGLGFSALAHSAVISKIATRSNTAAVTAMVPNSLGPAELLLHYGTKAQKDYYLPRLARGEELPCFALTGPYAGSDAASLPDKGIVCYGEVEGQRTLGMRVTWEKRYITLGPVATVMGLAFRLEDPDHILGETEDIGITLALVPTSTPGVEIGRRHYPARQAFQNGPNSGKDVFIPMDWVIGGQERVGQGWRMLMESLSAGRSISLPSVSTGAAKLCARTAGAYARVRKQFRVPIGRFEGVEEVLARIAGTAYLLESARTVTAVAVDQGEKPAVLSAIAKYHATERMRRTVDDTMDIHGGKAICDGPGNYLTNVYYSNPISITVEGANILTRNLIIFGQGAIRCHPYLLEEMHAAADADEARGLERFDKALFGHLGFVFGNFFRAFFLNLTGGAGAKAPRAGTATPYYRQLARASASFALVADLILALLGGALKRREMLSARLGDVLSEMYLMSTALKRFEDEERQADDLPLLRWCCETGLLEIERRLDEILTNFPSRLIGTLLRPVLFPWGRRRKGPSDELSRACARILLSPSPARDRLTRGIYLGRAPQDAVARLDQAMRTVIAADAIEDKVQDAVGRDAFVRDPAAAAARALEEGAINKLEADTLERAAAETRAVIMVDDFAPEELTGEGRQ